jgi:hypothetical protein
MSVEKNDKDLDIEKNDKEQEHTLPVPNPFDPNDKEK